MSYKLHIEQILLHGTEGKHVIAKLFVITICTYVHAFTGIYIYIYVLVIYIYIFYQNNRTKCFFLILEELIIVINERIILYSPKFSETLN